MFKSKAQPVSFADLPLNKVNQNKYQNMIRNIAFLKQPVDFSGLPSHGQDLDYLTDLSNEVFIAADFKYGDAGLSTGQRYTSYNLVETIGSTSPIFLAVVNHEYAAPETVDASGGLVTEVLYSWPSLGGVGSAVYHADEAMPFSRWIASIAVVYFLHHKLTHEARQAVDWYDTLFFDDPVLGQAWDSIEAKDLRRKYKPKHVKPKLARYKAQPDVMLLHMDKTSAEWAAYYDNAFRVLTAQAAANQKRSIDNFWR